MADVTVTAANVRSRMTGTQDRAVAAEPITPGQPYYLDSTNNNKAMVAVATTAAAADVAGIAINWADSGDWVYGIERGPVDVGASLTDGMPYYLSANSGGIAPYADLVTGNYVTLLGHGNDDGDLDLDINATGNALP